MSYYYRFRFYRDFTYKNIALVKNVNDICCFQFSIQLIHHTDFDSVLATLVNIRRRRQWLDRVNRTLGSSAKISDLYSRGDRFESWLGHRLFWATFEVLFLISLRKIPRKMRVIRLRPLLSSSFPIYYVHLPSIQSCRYILRN